MTTSPLHALSLGRRYDEAGQDAEGHILEGGGGAMVQLQHVFIRHGGQGRQVGRGELAGVAVADKPVHVLKVRQQGVEDIRRHGEGVLFRAARQSKRRAAGSQMYRPPSGAMPWSTAWVEDAVSCSFLVLW